MQVLQGMILYLENLNNTSRGGEIGGSDKAARGVEDAAPYAPPYGSRRGEHCLPGNLTLQRISGKATHKGNEHGRTLCAPTEHFFDRLGSLV